MTTMYGDRCSQYDGNRSRRLNINHDDEVEMTKNAKRIISQASGGLALTKDVKNSNLQRSYEILCEFIIRSATNNVNHGGALSLNVDDASREHFKINTKQPKWKILEALSTHLPINTRFQKKSRPCYPKQCPLGFEKPQVILTLKSWARIS